MINIQFEDTTALAWLKKRALKSYIKGLVLNERLSLGDISVVFCSDDYLLDVNKQYLNHDYYTDIITFDYTEGDKLAGDLFISIDRVKENAFRNKVALNHELHRVVFHGVLHLCGYKDKKKEDKLQMTTKENFYLDFFQVA